MSPTAATPSKSWRACAASARRRTRRGYQPKVIVTIDPDKKQLIVSDNGIGMTEDEVERYITQIAFSGAEEFLEKYKEKSEGDAGIIGHFGLGFYSAFMVSGTVEIQTLSYQEGAKPVHWVSSGEEEYEIEDGDRTEHGTTIIMNIAEDEPGIFAGGVHPRDSAQVLPVHAVRNLPQPARRGAHRL